MTSSAVRENRSAVWATPGAEGLATSPVDLCDGTLPVSGLALALMTDDWHGGRERRRGARPLEERQFTLRQGPCVNASRTGQPVRVPQPHLSADAAAVRRRGAGRAAPSGLGGCCRSTAA
jgi:hypothetical protein